MSFPCSKTVHVSLLPQQLGTNCLGCHLSSTISSKNLFLGLLSCGSWHKPKATSWTSSNLFKCLSQLHEITCRAGETGGGCCHCPHPQFSKYRGLPVPQATAGSLQVLVTPHAGVGKPLSSPEVPSRTWQTQGSESCLWLPLRLSRLLLHRTPIFSAFCLLFSVLCALPANRFQRTDSVCFLFLYPP